MPIHTIVIPSATPDGLNAPAELRFGRCSIFTLVIQEDGVIREVRVEFMPRSRPAGGPGVQVANFIAQYGVTDLIVGNLGPSAYYALPYKSPLKIYQIPWDKQYTVKELLDKLNGGTLAPFDRSRYPQDRSLPQGRAPPQGRGMGRGSQRGQRGRGGGYGGGQGRRGNF